MKVCTSPICTAWEELCAWKQIIEEDEGLAVHVPKHPANSAIVRSIVR